jgi:hypothetical protein
MSRESLAILVEQGRSFLDRQWEAFDSQDRKIAGLFALATGLITGVPAIVTAFGPNAVGIRVIPFALAAVAYLVSLPLHWLAYRPSEVHVIGNARAYYDEWLGFDEEDVYRWTLLDLAQQQEANGRELDEKMMHMRRAAIAVAAEAVALVTGVLTLVA